MPRSTRVSHVSTPAMQTAAMLAGEELQQMHDVQLCRLAIKRFPKWSWQARAIADRPKEAPPVITVEERKEIPGPDNVTMWPVAIIKVDRPAAGGMSQKISRSVLWYDHNETWQLLI